MATNVFPQVGSFGVWPTLAPTDLGELAFKRGQLSSRMIAYEDTGLGYLELPLSSAGDIELYNNQDSLQWGVALTDINASATDWVGFLYDDDLVYVVAVNETTTPDTFYLATVDNNVSTPVITTIGSGAQPSTDFTTPSTWFHTANPSTSGASSIQRESVGSGNIIVKQSVTGGAKEMTINISTGAIVSDPAAVSVETVAMGWTTQDGLRFAMGSIDPTIYGGTIGPIGFVEDAGTFVYDTDTTTRDATGLPFTSGAVLLQWREFVVIVYPTLAINVPYPRVWKITDFDNMIKSVYELRGQSI